MNKNFLTYLQLHIFELKYNLIIFLITFFYLFFILFYFSNQLIYIFTNILLNKTILTYFIFTNITEIFITNIFLAFIITCLIMIQILLIQLWFFFFKGFFKYENLKIIKLYILFFIFNIFILFIILIKIIPNIWFFFLNINFTSTFLFNIYFEPKINTFFNFFIYSFIHIYLLFFYLFILFLFCLNKINNIKIIITLRNFFYLKFLLISALITPPDLINQVTIFISLIIIFEIYIYLYIFLFKYILNKSRF